MVVQSCLSELLLTFSIIYDTTTTHYARKEVDMICLDFRKAFHSVPHKELLLKMSITVDLWFWFKKYLLKYATFRGAISDTSLLCFLESLKEVLQSFFCLQFVCPDSLTYSSCFLFADEVMCLNPSILPNITVRLWISGMCKNIKSKYQIQQKQCFK